MNIIDNIALNVETKCKNIDADTKLYLCYCKPNYHSNLKPGMLHSVTASTNLALSIFAAGLKDYYKVANELIRKVASYQCRSGECTGLWPYYIEENLDEMVAPDWNMADFNAYPMLIMLKEHKDKLEDDMFEIIKESCLYVCQSIIKRNLTPLYTNPTFMSVYITAVCGELFNRTDLLEYSREKLKKIYFLTMKDGTYNEHNCPGCYTKLILEIFAIILRHVNDAYIIEKITELNNLAWTMIGEHYHYQTGEFNGPNFREYVNFLGINERSVYQRAVSDDLGIVKKGEEVYNVSDIIGMTIDHFWKIV